MDDIYKRIEALENQQEELFVAVSRYVADKSTIVELVQQAVAEEFGINKNVFNNYVLYKKQGIRDESQKPETMARYWLTSILYAWFDKDVSWLEQNYRWYHRVYRQRFEERFANAIIEKEKRSVEEIKDRATYFNIMERIRNKFKENNLWNSSTELGLNFFELLK